MSKCELSAKGPVVKNLVSHSNRKTKTIAQPNVQYKRIYSQALDQMIRFKVAVSAIRDLEKTGGLDRYIINQKDNLLSRRALSLKFKILSKLNSTKSAKSK